MFFIFSKKNYSLRKRHLIKELFLLPLSSLDSDSGQGKLLQLQRSRVRLPEKTSVKLGNGSRVAVTHQIIPYILFYSIDFL